MPVRINYDGTFKIKRAASDVYAFLVTPDEFAPLMPYFKELKDVTPDGFTLVMEIGIPQIRGRAEVKVKRLPADDARVSKAAYSASGKHSLGMVDTRLSYVVNSIADMESEVSWQCESIVSGTLASLAQGILAPLAKRNIDQMVKSVQRALNGENEPESEKGGLWKRMSGGVKRAMASKGDDQ